MDILHACYDISDITRRKYSGPFPLHFENANVVRLKLLPVREKSDHIFLPDSAVEDSHVRNCSPVLIKHRIKNERAQRCLRIPFRRRNSVNNRLKNILRPQT